jgi:MerR family transcriptional regulator, copper efflux regulator
MLINELSKRTGITAHTIRYYEKFGLIKGKRREEVKSNKYFHYDDEAVYKLELIRDAKAAGFTLSEIRQLIDAWFNKKFTVNKKLSILDEKLKSIDEKIKQLKEVKKIIAEFKKEVAENNC